MNKNGEAILAYPTPVSVAQAVLEYDSSNPVAGSFGEVLTDAVNNTGLGTGGSLTITDVRNAVWNADITNYSASGTFGKRVGTDLLSWKKYIMLNE